MNRLFSGMVSGDTRLVLPPTYPTGVPVYVRIAGWTLWPSSSCPWSVTAESYTVTVDGEDIEFTREILDRIGSVPSEWSIACEIPGLSAGRHAIQIEAELHIVAGAALPGLYSWEASAQGELLVEDRASSSYVTARTSVGIRTETESAITIPRGHWVVPDFPLEVPYDVAPLPIALCGGVWVRPSGTEQYSYLQNVCWLPSVGQGGYFNVWSVLTPGHAKYIDIRIVPYDDPSEYLRRGIYEYCAETIELLRIQIMR